MIQHYDVVIIGAGPSGAVAAALLNKRGFNVCVVEKQHFPRFVIGESLLPHCMELLHEAGFLPAVQAGFGFQYKNGFAFSWGERNTSFKFTDKISPGPSTAFNVERARFDKILIDEAIKQGVTEQFGATVKAFDNHGDFAKLVVQQEGGDPYVLGARFVLDASGYHRVLPRMLSWDIPSDLPLRHVHFTHIEDHITDPAFDRNKNLVCVHPEHRDIWLWLIPFSNGRASIGVVGLPEKLGQESSAVILKKFALEVPFLRRILKNAQWDNDFPFIYLPGYSASVKSLYGRHFALLGNAAEFLDPVFSSGVTIATHSAKLAADLVARHLNGQQVNWQNEFARPLMSGVNVFRHYVEAWYSGTLQDMIFSGQRTPETDRMLSAVFAGYVWDQNNPYVHDAQLFTSQIWEPAPKHDTAEAG